MPVFNGGRFLGQAIDSILGQTFSDLELIVIDDGSSDGSAQVAHHYARGDQRVRPYTQENRGVTAALNRGCRLAKGTYLAIMDDDDRSLPNRLERQVSYLEAHPEIGIVGSWAEWIDERDHPRTQRYRCVPTSPELVSWSLLFRCSVIHPSVMMRTSLLRELDFYDPTFLFASDYDLWIRASARTAIASLPEVLLEWREWPGRLSRRCVAVQQRERPAVSMNAISRLLKCEPPRRVIEAFPNLERGLWRGPGLELELIESVACLIERLYDAHLSQTAPSAAVARQIADDAGAKLCALAVAAFWHSPRRSQAILSRALQLSPERLPIECLVTGITRAGWRLDRRALS